MASSDKVNLLGKREPEDDLETKPILKKHKENSEDEEKKEQIKGTVELLETKSDQAPVKETVEGLDETPDSVEVPKKYMSGLLIRCFPSRKKTLYVCCLPRDTKMPDIIDFFKDVGQVVSVQLTTKRNGLRLSTGFVEFASANEAKKALDMKNGEYLCGNKLILGMASCENICTTQVLHISQGTKTTFNKKAFRLKKRRHLPILFRLDFFNDVGEVVSVRLIVSPESKHVGYGFVEFASPCLANMALEKKNGEYLHDHKIFLGVAKTAPYPPRIKYNLAEKLWYEDYLLRDSLLIEEDETVEGLDETPSCVEAVALREKVLIIAHVPRRTKISHIIDFFKDAGQVVNVRLIVDQKGKPFGRGFVEFTSADEAKKALEMKNGKYLLDREIYLKTAPYRPRPKYEDYLRQENRLIEEDETVEGLDETPDSDYLEEVAVRKKTLFIANLPLKSEMPHIINFFRDVGEVVSVRLIVDHRGKHVGCGFVEFASAYKAKKALEKKNLRRLRNRYVVLVEAEIAPYPLRPKYEDYLREESLLIEADDLENKQKKKKIKEKYLGVFCGVKTTFSDDD
ncbi:unnamed protein product [Arabidopsis thaliana]|uniref:RRM domain-containing protein n=1 Tax=Arabidopsis thaliana TaxID=3702 RepID=A0A5S9XJ22_ARATH|nr:unnamed protein product [Arabidopsis thaliana]